MTALHWQLADSFNGTKKKTEIAIKVMDDVMLSAMHPAQARQQSGAGDC